MLRDVFYYGQKPNVHPRERHAKNLADARKQSTTEHFWVINEFCDYRNFDWDFDFDFLPDQDVWAENHNNVWPSTHQKDSGTWLCSKKFSDVIVYRCDVDKIKRKKTISSNWKILENIDMAKWDFSWHPDPTDPPYIYKWGCKFFPVELKTCIEYHVEGATNIKYMNHIVELLPNWENIKEYQKIDYSKFDMSWRPSPLDPPLIYVWGNKFVDGTTAPTLEYHVPGATEKKYLPELVFLLPNREKFEHLEDSYGIDYSWIPNPTSPPYIYVWGNQWNKPEDKISIQYIVEGATEYKFMPERATRKQCMENWNIPENIDVSNFDFSWEPSPADPPYIYQFGTQHQKTGGPRYIVPGADSVKYVDTLHATKIADKTKFAILNNLKIASFDYSWHPDDTEEPYIYVFGNNFYPGEIMPTVEYAMPGAKQIKYVQNVIAILDVDKTNWEIPENVDVSTIDFTWKPNPKDPPYIYQYGTQHQKSGGPRYIVPGATEIKYVDKQAIALPQKDKFTVLDNIVVADFDWSWHPDDTEEPYIYVFGNNQYPAEIMPTIEYAMPGATQIKYIHDIVAKLGVSTLNWIIPENIDTTEFDFSWKPNPKDPAYIYEFGTQWQKTGGPKYTVEGATEIKYIDTQVSKALPNSNNWILPSNIDVTDFDFSWHPDSTSPPYIYHFATQWALSGGPIYKVEGATEIKYMEEPCAKALPNKENWEVPNDIDIDSFDFSWHPYVEDQPYIYQFGTQHQKTGGPKYITPGTVATSPIKYIDTRILKAKKLPNRKNFAVLNNYKIKDFDWSWHPDDTEEPYIYVFGNNQYSAEIMPTVEYTMPGAKEIKYVHDITATLDVDMTNWSIPKNIDTTEFDFSWKPNPKDPAYIYEFGTQWQKTGGPKYVVEGATQVKYVEGSKAKSLPNKNNWLLPKDIPIIEFDYSWHPDSTEDSYIYVFGTQWQMTAGPRYVIEGATEYKYMDVNFAKVGPTTENWEIPPDLILQDFDFSWHPHPDDPTFIYEFGTQWHDRGGPRYIASGANKDTPIKYIDTRVIKATLGPNKNNWYIPEGVSVDNFDYSWVPHPNDPPYIYRWGNKFVSNIYKSTIEYRVPNATETKYMSNDVNVLPEWDRWVIPKDVDTTGFDFSWRPDPLEPDFIWQFGTQWQKTGGPRYIVPGATETKYLTTMKVKRLPSKSNWFNPYKVDTSKFDYSWHPDDTSPPYIYQFGTLLNRDDGPRYITPNSRGEIIYLPKVETEEEFVEEIITPSIVENTQVNKYYIDTTLEDLVNQHPNEVFWAMNKNIDYKYFNFDWRPESLRDMEYVQVFGSQDSEMTHTYFVSAKLYLSGNKNFKFINNIKLNEQELSKLFIKPDIFFVDRGNKESQTRFEKLKEKHKNIQKTRFLNSWVDTINRCINRSSTELCWILNSELDYTNFDFNFYPNPWQMKMVHVFGTQWNHWGTTFMVNRETFANDTKYIKVIEHLNNLNFVKDRIATANSVVHDIIYIDHGNLDEDTITTIKNEGKLVVKYDNDYLTTFKTILSKLPEKKEHFVWIVSSVCEYDKFDFTYICDPYAREQLHVFPSDRQKFGDTFFVNVNRLRELVNNMQSLKDYDKINYNQALRTSRLPAPVIVNEFDSHVMGVMQEFDFPYATFVTSDNKDIVAMDDEPMSLWDQESKTVLITSTGGTRIVVPKEAKQYVETQLYDYPYIKTASRLAKSNPLDIVYLSNGEKCAEENYEHLEKITKGLPNRLVRVDGVNGRVQAYHAAAEASNTSWFLTVFAKLKVNAKFDFNWQPDRLQIPKHYMFLARNPVNGLIYGHQGLIAYNKQMTLENDGQGLDFTLDSPHETIELLSGIATFNTDEFSTWRTAFREAIKLKKENSEISLKRLEAWTTKAEGDFAQYSLSGAKDGVAYYDKVKGKIDKLKLSYEWDWLSTHFRKKYK